MDIKLLEVVKVPQHQPIFSPYNASNNALREEEGFYWIKEDVYVLEGIESYLKGLKQGFT